ncbi:MAG: lysophospholipid acyltransferase family protein [Armatimonas sp.]
MLTWLCRTLLRCGVWLTLQFLGGLRFRGKKNVPQPGGVLLCPNHVCDADPAVMFVAMPRTAHYMAKAELFDIKFLGKLIRICNAFPIKRDSADRSALRHAEELLKAGEAVVVFPEGGGNFENTLQPLQPGALLIALRARVPVVPVALKNTYYMLPYGETRPRRSPIPAEVIFGEPLDISDLYGKKGAVEEATRRLTERLAQMLNQPVPTKPYVPHDERE